MTDGRTRYDLVPYPSKSYKYSHLDRLHVLARLFGMRPAPVEGCRVLELGCGDGSNMIPMAVRLPGSSFLGVDLAREAIAAGRARAEAAGAANLRFEAMDIAAFPEDSGAFDYIIVHGVWSWVPDPVREAMLALCRRHLAPEGVAYISYNTYPGWHLHRVARDAMRIHGELFDAPMDQVQQGQTLLRLMARTLGKSDSAYARVVQEEAAILDRFDVNYFYHDFFSPENRPVIFRDFVARAAAHQLQYLGEAAFGHMLPTGFPADLAGTLSRLAPDVVALEQYMDLFRGTGFRRTLLCHEERALKRSLSGEDLHGLRLGFIGEAGTVVEDPAGDAPLAFRSRDGLNLEVTGAFGKAAMRLLAALAPAEIEFDALRDLARESLSVPRDDADEIKILGGIVLHAFAVEVVEIAPRARAHVAAVSARPLAEPFARLDVSLGRDALTNHRHEVVPLTPFDREFVPLLDGEHDLPEIQQALELAVRDGRLTVTVGDEPRTEPEVVSRAVERTLRARLEFLMRAACLVG